MRKFVGALILSGVLMSPIVMRAEDQRVYDPYSKDYHAWNAGEERAYRHWLTEERHEKYRDWKHANKKEQREYWRWRHDHSDWH